MSKSSFLTLANREALERVETAQRHVSLSQLQDQPNDRASFIGTLTAADTIGLICEIKRASPSKGHMADIPDPAGLAQQYLAGGANCLSVLTEPKHFLGSLDDLDAITAAVAAPVLRKDFYVTPYQIWEARAHQASCILLIAASLSDDHLADLLGTTWEAGLSALIETHSVEEVNRMVSIYQTMTPSDAANEHLMLGVNTRNLHDLTIDHTLIPSIASQISLPDGTVFVAESGVRGPHDVVDYANAGAHAVLVGEFVATHADPQAAVRSLVDAVQP